MSSEETYELIERYLTGTLSSEELSSFEARMHADADFAEEVNAHKMANEVIIDNALLDIKKQLQAIHEETKVDDGNNFIKLLTGILASALVVGIVYLFYPTNEVETKAQLQSEQEKTEVVIQHHSPNNEEIKEVTQEVLNKLKQKKIQIKAIKKADELVSEQEKLHSKLEIESDENIPVAIANNPDKKNEMTTISNVVESIATPKIVENDPCEDTNIDVNVTAIGSCTGQKSGSIVFEEPVFSGTSPFQYSIDGGKHFSPSLSFEGLLPKNYSTQIKDANNCISETKWVNVTQKECYFTIHPALEQFWEIPLQSFNGEDVSIQIKNERSGAIVYDEIVSSNFPKSWKGTDQNGASLPMGSYSYHIKSLGSSKEEIGSITIVR